MQCLLIDSHFIDSPFRGQPTHRQSYKWTFHRHPTHLQGQLIDRAMLGANSLTACMKLGFQEPPTLSMKWAVNEMAVDESPPHRFIYLGPATLQELAYKKVY